MDEIARKKAEQRGDNRLWTPLDALEEATEIMKNKDQSKVHLVVHWFEDLEDGSRKYQYAAANCTFPEHMALTQVSQHRLIHDWTE